MCQLGGWWECAGAGALGRRRESWVGGMGCPKVPAGWRRLRTAVSAPLLSLLTGLTYLLSLLVCWEVVGKENGVVVVAGAGFA